MIQILYFYEIEKNCKLNISTCGKSCPLLIALSSLSAFLPFLSPVWPRSNLTLCNFSSRVASSTQGVNNIFLESVRYFRFGGCVSFLGCCSNISHKTTEIYSLIVLAALRKKVFHTSFWASSGCWQSFVFLG